MRAGRRRTAGALALAGLLALTGCAYDLVPEPSAAEARQMAEALPLTIADWGADGEDWEADDPYEYGASQWAEVDGECVQRDVITPDSVEAEYSRSVYVDGIGADEVRVDAISSVVVHDSVAGARQQLADWRAGVERCATQYDEEGEVAWKEVRLGRLTLPDEIDDYVSEEGLWETDSGSDIHYVYVLARRGRVVFSAYVDAYNTEEMRGMNRDYAVRAVSTMSDRI
ncbi:hypothetical protein [Allostreptomyces psammosilenae]|uniref:PknH-like extracellular domain-containing protein n=1 Tax=Allostreptomyces psammosilenae TaxID=1892865 RepID=A0A853A1H2_9ACTN|nr:hypothetical protein [Allostreptomyces psammosilenae]NYI08255.1 hypothetical protein [Allostreptomyces psammosilenae]